MWETVSVRSAQELFGLVTPSEITALVLWIAPCSVRIPVPRVIGQFGVLPVRDGSPSGRKSSSDDRLRVHFVEFRRRKNVDRRPHRLIGVECGRLPSRHIHSDRLGYRRQRRGTDRATQNGGTENQWLQRTIGHDAIRQETPTRFAS